jgi:hypothetical protein
MEFLNELVEIRKVALKEVDDTRATVFHQKLIEYVGLQIDSIQNELRRKVKADPKLNQFWVQRTFKAEDPVGMCRVFSSAEKTRNLQQSLQTTYPHFIITVKDTPCHTKGKCIPSKPKSVIPFFEERLQEHSVLLTFTVHLSTVQDSSIR